MADSILKSALVGRMSGAPISVGGMSIMNAKLEWIAPYIHDINQIAGISIDPDMFQRWLGLAVMITGFILPIISKIREAKR